MVTIHKDSHLDHALTSDQIAWLLSQFTDKSGSFIATVTLPEELGTVPCGLYGPLMGDAPVPENDVTYERRGLRAWQSRMVDRPMRQVREVSVIAGPHDGLDCVLYTAFGGPVTPQEPHDPGCKDVQKSHECWAMHALAK